MAGLLVVAVFLSNFSGRQPATAASGNYTPGHNYNVRDGMKYGYDLDITPQEKASGQIVKTVYMFSYLGQNKDGRIVIQSVDTPSYHWTCTNPCQMIVADTDGLVDTRFAYDDGDGSAQAQAIQDAINGQLVVDTDAVAANQASAKAQADADRAIPANVP